LEGGKRTLEEDEVIKMLTVTKETTLNGTPMIVAVASSPAMVEQMWDQGVSNCGAGFVA